MVSTSGLKISFKRKTSLLFSFEGVKKPFLGCGPYHSICQYILLQNDFEEFLSSYLSPAMIVHISQSCFHSINPFFLLLCLQILTLHSLLIASASASALLLPPSFFPIPIEPTISCQCKTSSAHVIYFHFFFSCVVF